jgi:ABC-2 type transport system ATP-binding protein
MYEFAWWWVHWRVDQCGGIPERTPNPGAVVDVVVSVEGLRKSYGSFVAVEDVTFDVTRGEIFGLLGPNGAGKTTTVECLQGLRHPDGGKLRVLGLDPQTDSSELRGRVGGQLQESALPDRMKVWEALDFFSSLSPSGADPETLLAEWDLIEKRNAAFASLSGGQRQRLFIALALVNRPEVVFLDEMTTGLDPAARRATWTLIETVRDQGTTVVLVSHFMDEAERLCDRLAVVNDHRVVALDTPQGLIAEYAPDVQVRFTAGGADVSWLRSVPHVASVEAQDGTVVVTGHGPVLAHVGAALVSHGLEPTDLRLHRATLEDVFLRIVGRTDE